MSQSIFKKLKLAVVVSAMAIGSAFAAPAGSIIDQILTVGLKNSEALARVLKGQAGEEAAETIVSILASKSRSQLGKPVSELNEAEVISLLNPSNDSALAKLLTTKLDDLAEPEVKELMDKMTALAYGLSQRADSGVATCSACATTSGRAKAIQIDEAIQNSLAAKYGDMATTEALDKEVQSLLRSSYIKDRKVKAAIRESYKSIDPEFQKMFLAAFHTHQMTGAAATDSRALLTAIVRFSGEEILDNQLVRVLVNSKRAKGEWTKLFNSAADLAAEKNITAREAMEQILEEKAAANGMKKEWEEVKQKNLCGLFGSAKA